MGFLCGIFVLSFCLPYYSKQKFFMALKQFLQAVDINVCFLQNNIHNIISTSKFNNTDFQHIIKSYQNYLLTKDEQIFLNDINKIGILSDDDKTYISNYFLTLGHTDCDTQTSNTKTIKQYIEQRLNNANEDIQTKAMLIQKLAIIAGLVVFILLC